MPDLNLDLDYFDHPQTKRLVGLLGRGAEVLPIKLWIYCGKFHADTGSLAAYEDQEIESLVDWWGKEGQAIEALIKVGFIERDDNGKCFMHNWLKRQGHFAAIKKHMQMMAEKRWTKIHPPPVSIADRNAGRNAPTNQPTNQPLSPGKRERGGGGRKVVKAVPSLGEVFAERKK